MTIQKKYIPLFAWATIFQIITFATHYGFTDNKKITLKGSIFSSNDKKPIKDASIFAGLQFIKSKADGTFEVVVNKEMPLLITVFAEGYNPSSTIIDASQRKGIIPPIYLSTANATFQSQEQDKKELDNKDSNASTGSATEKTSQLRSGQEEDPSNIIRAYYRAIDSKDYAKAASYRKGASSKKLKKQYQPFIKSVKISKIEKVRHVMKNKICYQVSFNAVYIKEYPAGSGHLPQFHCVAKDKKNRWKIVSISTGP